jgi:hypothetical protein
MPHRLLVGFVVGCCACSARDIARPPVSTDDGGTSIRVVNNVGWPYRWTRVLLAVDGSVQQSIQDAGGIDDVELGASVDLAPGSHSLDLLAVFAVPAAFSSDECVVTVRSSDSLSIGRAARQADVGFELYQGDVTRDFGERIQVGVHRRDATHLPPRTAALVDRDARFPTCAGKGGVDGTLCRLQERVEAARSVGDAALVACYTRSLEGVRAHARHLETRRGANAAAAEAPEDEDGWGLAPPAAPSGELGESFSPGPNEAVRRFERQAMECRTHDDWALDDQVLSSPRPSVRVATQNCEGAPP